MSALRAAVERYPASVAAVLALVFLLAWLSHAPTVVHFPRLWAEDATVFLSQAAANQLESLIEPYAGYLHLLPRIVALLVVTWAPVDAYADAALLGYAIAVTAMFWFLLTSSLPWRRRLALCTGVAVFSPPGEVVRTITNLQWLALLVVVVATIEDERVVCRPRWATAVAAGLCALTGPFSAIWTPIWAALGGRMAWRNRAAILIAAGAALQLGVWLLTRSDSGHDIHPSWRLFESFVGNASRDPYLVAFAALGVIAMVAAVRFGEERIYLRHVSALGCMAVAIALLGWFKETDRFPAFVIGGHGGRYMFAECVLLWIALCLPTSARLTKACVLVALVPLVLGWLNFSSRYQNIEWWWRESVAAATTLGLDRVAAAPPEWALLLHPNMHGQDRLPRLLTAKVGRAAPSCSTVQLVRAQQSGLGLRLVFAVPRTVGDASSVAVFNGPTLVGHTPVRRPLWSASARAESHAAVLTVANAPSEQARVGVFGSAGEVLCWSAFRDFVRPATR